MSGGKGATMNLLHQPRRVSRRGVALLVAGLIAGAAVLTPALGSAAAFLTKKKGDKRYLQNTSVVTTSVNSPGATPGSGTVNCPAGRQALSGGADSPFFLGSSMGEGMIIMETRPVPTSGRATGWYVEFITGTNPTPVTIHVVCAP